MISQSVRIAGSGSAVPAAVLSNADLTRRLETSDEWIFARTGIRERRIAGPDEHPSVLGARAARMALEDAGIGADDVDLILCANTLADRVFPTTACSIQHLLGATRAGALDMNAACTGFVYCLHAAWGFVAGGRYRNVLCIGTETLSRMVDYEDRGTAVIFGDGAGAMVLQPNAEGDGDFLVGELGADGGQGEALQVPAGGARRPAHTPGIPARDFMMQMDGRVVYRFAVQKFVDLTERALAQAGVTLADLALIVPHQVNRRLIESACEKLGCPTEKVIINIEKYGNTSSASIPIAFDEARRAGRLSRGDLVLLVAFGGGLTWGSLLIRY